MSDVLRYSRAVALLCLCFLGGCANQALTDARKQHYLGNYQAASDALGDCSNISKKSKLLCLMEKGTTLFNLGKYEESSRYFLRATRFVKDTDYVSVSQQASASLINDYMIDYQGEYAEQLWIHSYLIMNFLLLNNYEAARVEAKQALEVLDAHPEALRKAFFSRGLIALCFELFNQYSDARIEYDIIAEQSDKPANRPEPLTGNLGEVVLFVSEGKAPIKEAVELVVPQSTKISIPQYRQLSPFYIPELYQSKKDSKHKVYSLSSNVFEIADNSLDSRKAEIIARQAVRAAGKEAMARSFKDKGGAELLVRIALLAVEHADVRSWHTLPAGLSLMRLPLEPGKHKLLLGVGSHAEKQIEVTINPREREFRAVHF